MNNYQKIYWLTRLDNLQGFCITLFIFSLIVFIVYHVAMFVNCSDEDDREEYKFKYLKYRNISFWVGLFMGLCLVFIPTKNDMILIYAGGKTMDYVQSDTSLAKIPYQTTSIISEYLEKSIKELRENEK